MLAYNYCLVLVSVFLVVLCQCRVQGNSCVPKGGLASEVNRPSLRPADKKSWAIVALTRKLGGEETRARNEAIAWRIKPYAAKHNLTVVFFSEVDVPKDSFQSWNRIFKGIADVKYINTAGKKLSKDEGGNDKGFGYKYMCKFFGIDMYEYLKDFDYYFRLDSDCYITRMKYDIFQWAEDHDLGYGYAARKLEAHKETRDTLPAFTRTYAEKCGVAPAISAEPLSLCYNFYNNFHLGRVSFWRRPDVKDYLQAILASSGIAAHRWGDSTIQAYAVRLFMEPDQVLFVPDFAYVHGSHQNMQIDTAHNGKNSRLPQKLEPLANKYQHAGFKVKQYDPKLTPATMMH